MSLPLFFPSPLRLKPPHSTRLSTNAPPSQSLSSGSQKTGVIVIGAGLSGLAAATRLNSDNIPFLLIESSSSVGGRVQTDTIDGFTLDRGFQIFITAYPEAQKLLNYSALNLQKFYSGAKVYYNGEFHTIADPARHLFDSVKSLKNPIGSLVDKLLIGLNRINVLIKSDEEILSGEEMCTIDSLRRFGFSEAIIERFFRPFFGGIFFDNELETSSRLFEFIFKVLALGDNTLPAKGIVSIPKQLASNLPSNSILLNSKVVDIEGGEQDYRVRLENGDVLGSEYGVIIAVEEDELDKLLKRDVEPERKSKRPVRSTVCLYFSADEGKIPVHDPVLYLNGSGKGIVNNMFFATNVARSYGPQGKALVSVSLVGLYEDVSDDDLISEVVMELSNWFGKEMVGSWKHLRTYRIRFAQPNQSPPTDFSKSPKIGPGLYVCGDHSYSATFDGALVSGKRAAEALLNDRALVGV